jgi:uncharacterized membrane protein YccC
MSSRVPAKDHPTWRVDTRQAAVHSVALAISCVVSYWLVTELLAQVYFLSRADDLLGGLWAVIATAFVYRESYNGSRPAALSRMAATSLSFVLCLAYLLVLPFHLWGLAVLIGLGTFVLMVIGRPEDAITAAITTAVLMVSAVLSPHNAWQQPVLRLVDTAVGVAVGVAAAWVSSRLTGVTVDQGSTQDALIGGGG